MTVSAGAPEALLAALDPEQRAVAEALRGPVRVLAGAGTGKTRAITHRIAHGVAAGVYQPTEVLAVTFTTRAAGEMRQRLRALGAPGVQARTFHSAALRQLRFFWPRVYGGEPPVLVESKLGLIATAARRNRVPGDQSTLRDLASEVEWSKVSNVRPEDYPRLAEQHRREVTGLDPDTVARVFSTYEDLKREQGRMDMEDVLLVGAALLAEDERVAAEVRRQYKWFVVDEFQDVSPVQATLLDLWLGGRDEICVVGDPAQTIYSFAGASPAYLRGFTARYPHATTVELVCNYRSTPQVVHVANELLSGTPSAGVRLVAQSAAGPEVAWSEHADEVAEAEAAAEWLAARHADGTPWRECAVLFRINAQSESFEEALAARGVPYVLRGAARFFDRPEVRQAVTLLRGEARAAGRGGGAADGDGLVARVSAVLAGMEWTPTPPAGRGARRDRWESLQALVAQAGDWVAEARDAAGTEAPAEGEGDTDPDDLAAFVAELERRAAEQHAPVADGVTLATMHAAKGLEWDAVVVAGVQEGSVPFSYAETAEDVEEERRLLYVACTRARSHLSVSWSRARNPGGRATRKPSRFLTGVRPQVGSDVPAQRGSSRRRGPGRCRVCAQPLGTAAERKTGHHEGCPVPYDVAVFEALRSWRSERAAQDQVPAYVVFTDATLQALAESRPSDHGGLLRVSGIGQSKADRYGDEVLAVLDRNGDDTGGLEP